MYKVKTYKIYKNPGLSGANTARTYPSFLSFWLLTPLIITLQFPQKWSVHLLLYFFTNHSAECNQKSNQTVEAVNHTYSFKPNPPITELFTITNATTTYQKKKKKKEKKAAKFPKLKNFLLQTFSLTEIFVLYVFVVFRNCYGYD